MLCMYSVRCVCYSDTLSVTINIYIYITICDYYVCPPSCVIIKGQSYFVNARVCTYICLVQKYVTFGDEDGIFGENNYLIFLLRL